MVSRPTPYFMADDDFIDTISDDEDGIPDFDEEEGASEGEQDAEDAHSTNSDTGNLKRKRDDESSWTERKSEKKRRKQADTAVNRGDTPRPSNSNKVDDTFDPDFEFSLETPEQGFLGQIDGFDVDEVGVGGTGVTRGTSVEEIIARRRRAQREGDDMNEGEGSDESGDEDEMNGDEQDEEDDADDVGFEGFEGQDEDAEEGSEAEGSGSEEESYRPEPDKRTFQVNGNKVNGHVPDQAEAASEDEDEDDVAEPVPHPDDDSPFQDGNSEAEEEDEDVETTKRRDAFFASGDADTKGQPISTTDASFQSMSLSRQVLRGLAASGFNNPTPIQAKAIPMALMGKDIVGGAVTGSGKTAAFLIPILERLLYRDRKIPTTRVGILLPTRELAVQCHKVATKLASTVSGLSIALVVGGLSVREQEQTLKQRPDIVIATPGRFIDHMRNTASFAVENLEILVLDEADRMLEDGFADELNEILTTIPKSRQTMLFSATMTEDVDQLIRVGLSKPVRLMVDAKRQTVSGLVQEFIKMKASRDEIDEERRLAYLLHLCMHTYTAKTIVFFPRKSSAHEVKVLFALFGLKAAELHGSMSQEQRMHAMARFQAGECTHLLATDLASRGLDIPKVETVINFTVPTTSTTYLHRVGRTARAGLSGVSCTLFSPSKKEPTKSKGKQGGAAERTLMRPIMKLAKSQKATIRTRSLPVDIVNSLTDKIRSLHDEIESILAEEKEERLMQQSERDMTKGENLMKHEDEIMSRPRRTWFQSEKEKQAASKLGVEERTGMDPSKPKKEKKKLSGNDKKKLLNRDDRVDGKGSGWKKGKDERAGKGVLEKEKQQKRDKTKAKKKGASPAKPMKARGKVPKRR